MVIFRDVLFFRPPDTNLKKIPVNQLIKKFWPKLEYIEYPDEMLQK